MVLKTIHFLLYLLLQTILYLFAHTCYHSLPMYYTNRLAVTSHLKIKKWLNSPSDAGGLSHLEGRVDPLGKALKTPLATMEGELGHHIFWGRTKYGLYPSIYT